MQSGFDRHNIKHLSASSINMFADCAGAWAARYLFDYKFKFGVAPQIGILTEKVVQDVLLGASFDDALKAAQATFNRDNALNMSEKDMARIDDISAMAKLALDELKQYGEPEFIETINGPEQQKIEIMCNGGDWKIPVIGYLDFVYPRHGLLIDLKTTLRMPSTMSMAHQRQSAIYRAAKGNMAVKFLYVTPKKTALLEVQDQQAALDSVKAIAKRMEAFLRAHDKEQIKACVPVNVDSFYWGGDRAILKELYGL